MCIAVSRPETSLMLKDLIPVLYQEGSYQGEPVTLGVGGFGKVELVWEKSPFYFLSVQNVRMSCQNKFRIQKAVLSIHTIVMLFWFDLLKYEHICLFVYQVTTLQHRKYFAMKKISKQHVVAKKQEGHILLEKKILQAVRCDFIVRLVLLPTSPIIISFVQAIRWLFTFNLLSDFSPLVQAACCLQRFSLHLYDNGVLPWWGNLDQAKRSVRYSWVSDVWGEHPIKPTVVLFLYYI